MRSEYAIDRQKTTAEEAETVAEGSIALMDPARKYADADLFRELGEWTLQWLMEAEIGATSA